MEFTNESATQRQNELRNFGLDVVMKSGCPTVSSQAWQIGLFGRAHEVPTATGCPIAVEQAAQIKTLPQRSTQQCEEAGEAVAQLAQERTEAQQQTYQQRCPNLLTHGVGVVTEEVRGARASASVF